MNQIKFFIYRIVLITTCIICSDVINASDFEVDGICYNKIPDTINEGLNASISFNANNGYRIKSVNVNSSDVTSNDFNNRYSVSNIKRNTSVGVEFEAIPTTIDITQYISAVSVGGSIMQTNNLINSGSQLNWTFSNASTENVTLNSLQLIDGQSGSASNIMTVNQVVNANSSVSYTTTIGAAGIHTPVTCRFRYTYNGSEYSVDAKYTGNQGYSLSIKSTGNGQVKYNGKTIRNSAETYSVDFLSSATLTITPDDGYRIKSVRVNNSDVTSGVSNNSYTISFITSNQTVEVEFEAATINTYTLSIKASGNGSASYDGTTIRSKTSTFTVNQGTNATISFIADNGYRIKSVKVNSSDITSIVSNNQYTVSSIQRNTTVEVEFEAIPPTTYTLLISSTGSGYASYDGTTIRSKTSTFTVNEGTIATITFSADYGYRIKSVKVNSSDVTSNVSNNRYTVSNIQRNTTVEVEFEVIPPTTYTLSISSTGNGYALYAGTTIRSKTSTFTVNEGTNAPISFNVDNGYRIKSVKLNGSDVTSSVSNNWYTVSNIQRNTILEVEFEAIPPTTYTLSISSTGGGSVLYAGTTIRSKTNIFTVNQGTNATISFIADNGYRIKSVKVNGSDVTSIVSNNQYTVGNIQRNTTVEVEFESIPSTTYTLSISSTGNGSVSYAGTTISSKTSTFSVNEGANATISFSADNGYRIKSVMVNGSNVTSSLSNNTYTISSISRNTSVEVEFEIHPLFAEIDEKLLQLDENYVVASNKLNELHALVIKKLYLDANYWKEYATKVDSYQQKIASMAANITTYKSRQAELKQLGATDSELTAFLANINSVISDLETICKGIDKDYARLNEMCTLSVKVTGNGLVTYDGYTIQNQTRTFPVVKGTSATLFFNPESGNRIKSVIVNNSNVTSNVSNNQYTISNISNDASVEVEFEAIPSTTVVLSIIAIGNGYATYGGKSIRGKTEKFDVVEGTSATIMFLPDSGFRIKSVKVGLNNAGLPQDVTTDLINYSYTLSNITHDTNVYVEFELITAKTVSLEIKSVGNGSAFYNNISVRETTKTFTVIEGTNATVVFIPDDGYTIKTVKVGGVDVTSYLLNNQYTITKIIKDTSVEVEFREDLKAFSSNGLNYAVVSYDDKTVNLANGKYGTVLEVPATVTYQGVTWKVAGMDNAALANNEDLAAIIWNLSAAFTASVSNPNLLLYVNSASYAPAAIKNVVVNSIADNIVLTDAASGNTFYCPQEFIAKKISYTHNYGMITGLGESRGWETIALPFDVKKIAHSSKGELTPFANWKSGDSKKPFWLMSYGIGGWTNASSIKANTPYIISMPNNDDYKTEFRVNGNVTFSAENVIVKKSDDLQKGSYNGNTLVPNYANMDSNEILALNVNNDFVSYTGGAAEGSAFVANLRPVYPFEAYMTTASSARRYISINDDMTTGIEEFSVLMDESKGVRIYNLKGQLIMTEHGESIDEVGRLLPAGVYVVNGRKLIIK